MLAELRMELETDSPHLRYYQSSNMQGVLMSRVVQDYAKQMHEQGLKPYSQYVLSGERKEWVVHTLTREAYEHLLLPLLDAQFLEFTIEKKDIYVKIRKKELMTIAHEDLLREFYNDSCSRYLHMEFLTPASFKSDGRYVIVPDIRFIYQSLMNKYSAASMDMDMYDEETLQQLAYHSRIIRYRLKSTFFPLEGVKIPSFIGEMSIKVSGTETLARYVRLLAKFGEYSGIGIKTAIGMGAIRLKGGML